MNEELVHLIEWLVVPGGLAAIYWAWKVDRSLVKISVTLEQMADYEGRLRVLEDWKSSTGNGK